jgi:hypothetical protein
MFNPIGENSGALHAGYSDYGNGRVLFVGPLLLTVVPYGQPNANAHLVGDRKAPAKLYQPVENLILG